MTGPADQDQTDNTNAVTKATSVEDDEVTIPSFNSLGSGLVCQTSHCKTLATRMLSLMNHSVEPCDDFYEHACGGLRSNPSLLGDDPSKDVYDRIKRGLNTIVDSSCPAHKTFKRYYESCVQYDAVVSQEQRIAEARKIIDKVGQFNDIDNPNPVLTNLTSLIVKLMKYHSTPLFDLMLDVDGHNPAQFALKLTAPVFKPMFRPFDRREDCLKNKDTMTDLNSFYHDYITCKKEEHEMYLKELNDTIRIFKIPISASTITDIKQNMEFELLSLIEHLPSAGAMQQSLTSKDYVEIPIGDLIRDYPKVQWRTLIKSLLYRDLPDDTLVQVYFKEYLDNMLGNFTQLDTSKQQNVLLAWFAHDVYVDLFLTRDSCSRDAYCLRVASDLMEETASSLYLSTFAPETLQVMRAEAQQVFTQLQHRLEKQLYDAEWLDESSKSLAVGKLKNLKLTVDGGISVFLNETFLNDRMKEITQKDTNYITLSAALLKRYRRQMYSLYGANPSDPEAMWSHFLLPHSTQGIVVYALKNVVIPYGLMTHPMYEPALPRYLLMARLGFVIAHEMAHHFDVTGMTYGTNGRGDPLLSYDPSATFRDRANCLKDTTSFNGKKMADDGRSVSYRADQRLSLNERIADRTAAVLGYETYLAWVRDHGEPVQLPYLRLTNNEIYFLAIAQIFCSKSSILDYGVSLFEDEHLPPFLRVNTIMDNSQEFADVFQCKVGVDMNLSPDDKCEAFPKLTKGDGTDITPDDNY